MRKARTAEAFRASSIRSPYPLTLSTLLPLSGLLALPMDIQHLVPYNGSVHVAERAGKPEIKCHFSESGDRLLGTRRWHGRRAAGPLWKF